MGGPLRSAAARWIAAGLVLAAVTASVTLLVAARISGVSYWGTSLGLIAGFPFAVLGTMAAGWRTYHRGDPVVGRWLLVTAASLLVYLVSVAALTWLAAIEGHEGPFIDWLAPPALGGHVLPFLLLQVALLTTRDRLAGSDRRRPLVILLMAIATGSLLV
ncbi:MAG: hypothetical protein ICV70_02370, partial [Jiangellaceae bacterium]|nr:hypothetical protein [Jiangellaceae bacterium]